MDDQAAMNGSASTARQAGTEQPSQGGLVNALEDLATLAELQARLATVDLRQSLEHARLPLIVVLLGFAVLLAAAFLALQALGKMLSVSLDMAPAWSMLLTAAIATAAAIPMLALGTLQIQHSFQRFQRSQKQLRLNLQWFRALLTKGSTASS